MKPTERFTDRVAHYVKFRPSYPPELIELLITQTGDACNKICADTGSGTGILTELLLPRFKTVVAVEPNLEMRSHAEKALARYPNFISIAAEAEHTGLPDSSIDLITAAQAFHWFDGKKFHAECHRILRPGGLVALIWNKRQTDTPFQDSYETLIRTYAADYKEVNHARITKERIAEFFGGGYRKAEFEYAQQFDLDGLYGRLDSSSFAPRQGAPEFDILRRELKKAFHMYSDAGMISFDYNTELYFGKVR